MPSDVAVATPRTPYPPLWAAVLEASQSAMLVAGVDRRILRANPAACALTGYTEEQLRSLMLEDLSLPEHREALIELWEASMRTHRASVCGARPLRVSGGSTIPVRFCAARVEGDRVLLVYHPSPDGVDLILNTSEPVGGEPTARQRQVITLLALGLTDDQMAQRLMLSPDTVRTHLRNAMRITRAYNRPHLVAKALQRGWIAQPA